MSRTGTEYWKPVLSMCEPSINLSKVLKIKKLNKEKKKTHRTSRALLTGGGGPVARQT